MNLNSEHHMAASEEAYEITLGELLRLLRSGGERVAAERAPRPSASAGRPSACESKGPSPSAQSGGVLIVGQPACLGHNECVTKCTETDAEAGEM
ncbi:hypothetical protein EYF80_056723 [Liparis tanakae]|uniref:Uncharacterized protein n=1 Tax=Liparis tanakae TaxID=230148 RepID=A0A4Z2EVY3_9TELE|nr:hypothetical protein EYF80_056723 [Liparis tanakae]